jgi:hypothetical protein
MLCQINNDPDHISEEVVNSLDGEVKTYLKCTLNRMSKIKRKGEISQMNFK